MKFPAWLPLLLLFATAFARAQTPDPSPMPDSKAAPERAFTMECKMVLLPVKLAVGLIPELSDDAKVSAAFLKLQGMLERGEATLAANLVSQGSERQRVESSSVLEIRYGTEFDPPQLPDRFPSDAAAIQALKNWPAVAITPTSFETRNTGPIIKWVTV